MIFQKILRKCRSKIEIVKCLKCYLIKFLNSEALTKTDFEYIKNLNHFEDFVPLNLNPLAASLHDLDIDSTYRTLISSFIALALASDIPDLLYINENELLETLLGGESDKLVIGRGLHGGSAHGYFEVPCGSQAIQDSNVTTGFRFPALDWNHFRKGYSLLLWIRPILSRAEVLSNKDYETKSGGTLYQFQCSTSAAKFVSVSFESPFEYEEDQSDGDGRLVKTTVKIIYPPKQQVPGHFELPYHTGTLRLIPGEWQLLAITHSMPYLRSSKVAISVNGNIQLSAEVPYLVNERKGHARDVCDDCVVLDGLNCSGVVEKFRVASIGLYQTDLHPNVLSATAEQGPNTTWALGHILHPHHTHYPLNRNTHVGIPNGGVEDHVHKAVLCYHPHNIKSTYTTVKSGSGTVVSKRVCENSAKIKECAGSLEGARSGLIIPVPDQGTMTNSFTDYLSVNGNVRVGNISKKPLVSFTLAWQTANGLGASLQPFFLSLPPLSSNFEHLTDIHTQSNQHLSFLLSNHEQFAVSLLRLFASTIRSSYTFRDEASQKSLPFVVSNLLRRVLLRKTQIYYNKGNEYKVSTIVEEDLARVSQVALPDTLADALVMVLTSCCGVTSNLSESRATFEDTSGALLMRRVSDLAVMALHGMGLDLSLRSPTVLSKTANLYAPALFHSTLGVRNKQSRFMRMKLTVETFLSMIKFQYSNTDNGKALDDLDRIQRIVLSLAQILSSLIHASLSDPNSITAAERDIDSSVMVLIECPLGTIPSSVVVKGFCFLIQRIGPASNAQIQLEQRLARNLMRSQYHNLVGPVILGRIIKKLSYGSLSETSSVIYQESLWQFSWLNAMNVFLWLLTVCSKEQSTKISRSVGQWLLASAEAGALDGVLVSPFQNGLATIEQEMVMLFGDICLSPNEKERRLMELLPFLPALTLNLLRMMGFGGNEKILVKKNCNEELEVLTSLVASSAAAIKGQINTMGKSFKMNISKQYLKPSGSSVFEADEWGVDGPGPVMLKIATLLEGAMSFLNLKEPLDSNDSSYVKVFDNGSGSTDIASQLKACQDLSLDTCSSLLVNLLSGDAGVSLAAWKTAISAILQKDAFSFEGQASSTSVQQTFLEKEAYENKLYTSYSLLVMTMKHAVPGIANPSSKSNTKSAKALLLTARNLGGALSVYDQNELFKSVAQDNNSVGTLSYSLDQIEILKTLVRILQVGREDLGWFRANEHDSYLLYDKEPKAHIESSSQILPLLYIALRIALKIYVGGCCLFEDESYVDELVTELRSTLTAALVGLHPLSLARDLALEALSIITPIHQLNTEEIDGTEKKRLLTCLDFWWFLLNELHVRLLNEREKRNKHLKEHFPNELNEVTESTKGDASRSFVESMMLGTGSTLVTEETRSDSGHHLEGAMGGFENLSLEAAINQCLEFKPSPGAEAIEEYKVSDSNLRLLEPFLENSSASREMSAFDDDKDSYVEPKQIVNDQFLDHADLIAAFLELPTSSKGSDQQQSEGGNVDTMQAQYFRRFIRNVSHTNDLCTRHFGACICEICLSLFNRMERSIGDGTGSGMYSRLTTSPLSSISNFSRMLPSHFHGYDESIRNSFAPENIVEDDGDLDEFKAAIRLASTLRESNAIVDISNLELSDSEEEGETTPMKKLSVVDEGSEDEDDDEPTGTEKAAAPSHSVMQSLSNSRYEGSCCPPDGSYASGGAGPDPHLRVEGVLHVRAEGNRLGTLYLTDSHLLIEYESEFYEGELLALEEAKTRRNFASSEIEKNETELSEDNEDDGISHHDRFTVAVRPRAMRWALAETSQAYLRRYRLRDSALELFFIPSSGNGGGSFSSDNSVFFDFGAGKKGTIRRNDFADYVMRLTPEKCLKQWPDKSRLFLQETLQTLCNAWADGRISNFDYLLRLNILAGRSFNDLTQYPVFPWVLANYSSADLPDLSDRLNFRDLSKPVGALNESRLQDFLERYNSFSDHTIPPFMYGSHYSTSGGVVLHFLIRLHPFADLHRQLQSGHFDVPDRLFSSVARTWDMCTGSSAAEVKELTPEFYCDPAFLRNSNKFNFGKSQEGDIVSDVILPPWAKGSPEKFIDVMRAALESDVCTAMLPDWIDLIFGYKQQGPEAIEANNVFFHLTYYGSVDVSAIEDEELRKATELQIAHFGMCPRQLFRKQHPQKKRESPYAKGFGTAQASPLSKIYFSHGLYDTTTEDGLIQRKFSDGGKRKQYLPFLSAPLSYWCHLDPPPPGPHASLICIKLIGNDRVIAIDSNGIYHTFKWTWKAEAKKEKKISGSSHRKVQRWNSLLTSDDEDDVFFPPKNSSVEVFNDEEVDQEQKDSNEVDEDQISLSDNGCFVAQRELHNFRHVPRLPYSGDDKTENKMLAVACSKTLFASGTLLLVLSDGNGRGALSMQLIFPSTGRVKNHIIFPTVHTNQITSIHMDSLHGGGGDIAIVGSRDGTASVWRFVSSEFFPLRPKLRLGSHGDEGIHAVNVSNILSICITVSKSRCCIYSLATGALLRTMDPPENIGLPVDNPSTIFACTRTVCVSKKGFVILVCESKSVDKEGETSQLKPFITLQLFTVEGIHLGSQALDSWRGIPQRIIPLVEDSIAMVCCGGSVSLNRISALAPLDFVDEWIVFDDFSREDKIDSVCDVDVGPMPLQPVIAAAACSNGAVRLHALPGISPWSEVHKSTTTNTAVSAVGNVLSKPVRGIKNTIGTVSGASNKVVRVGSEIGKEAVSDVKEKGIGGFFGSIASKAQQLAKDIIDK